MSNNNIPIIAIIGKENTGKSTLFNTLTNTRQALTSHIAGFTRDRRYGSFSINGLLYSLIDTGGITEPQTAFYSDSVNAQVLKSIEEAELIYFVVSSEYDANLRELNILQTLRKKQKKVIVVASKLDKVNRSVLIDRNYSHLGYQVVPVASLRREIDELLAVTLSLLPGSAVEEEIEATESRPLICSIVGRPNVGKSTLINKIIAEERLVTCDYPGTTTDNVEIPFDHKGRKWLLVDTAGIRRKAKVDSEVETLSALRSLDLVYDVDITIVLLDGSMPNLTQQDLYLLRHCFTVRKKPVIIVINKSELLLGKQKLALEQEIKNRFPKLKDGVIHYTSALTGKGVSKLLYKIAKQYDAIPTKITSHALSAFLNKALTKYSNMHFKIKYAHVGGKNPLSIVLHGSKLYNVKTTEKLFLENLIRRFLKLSNSPLKIIIK